MKKILVIAFALFATTTMYADKKCCKGKDGAKKEACANKAEASVGMNADGTSNTPTGVDPANSTTSTASHGGCSKKSTTGSKACCAKKTEAAPSSAKPADSNVDQVK